MGYMGPLCIYAYFVTSSVINKFLMSSISSLVVRQERLEGDFRLVDSYAYTHAYGPGFVRALYSTLRVPNG